MPTRRAGEGVSAPEPKWVLIQESPESCSPVGSFTALTPGPGLSPPWPTAWRGLVSHLCLSRGWLGTGDSGPFAISFSNKRTC